MGFFGGRGTVSLRWNAEGDNPPVERETRARTFGRMVALLRKGEDTTTVYVTLRKIDRIGQRELKKKEEVGRN